MFLDNLGSDFYEILGASMPQFKIDFYLQEGTLMLGKKNFHILHTPGHSPGSISIYWPEKKALFPGDVIFYQGMGRTDFPQGSVMILKQSIERLSQLEIEYLLPGHGEIIKGKESVKNNFALVKKNFLGMP